MPSVLVLKKAALMRVFIKLLTLFILGRTMASSYIPTAKFDMFSRAPTHSFAPKPEASGF
jgi:hypothetical protein